MARISDAELDTMKREISLERLVVGHGIALARHGKDLVGRCPFHADDTPSLVISPDTNLWHCMGACQMGGSVIDWVMRAEGLPFRRAVEFLRAGGAPRVDLTKGPPPKKSTVLRLPALGDSALSEAEVFEKVVAHYHETLMGDAEAKGYLASRGLWHEEAAAHFRIGFSNRTLGYRLPDKNRKEGKVLREQLQRLGIYRESGHEHLVGCITVPLWDADGPQMYGRRMGKVDGDGPRHLYLPGPRRCVWNASGLGREVVLCESLFDALTFWVAGFRSVTCAYGVEGFGEAHLAAFAAAGVETVRIAFDRDAAGDAAAAKVSALLNAAGLETFRVQFPRGMDANEYACKVQPAKESLGLALRKAEWMGKGGAKAMQAAPELGAVTEPEAAIAAAKEPEQEQLKEESPVRAACTELPDRDELVYRLGDRVWRVRGLSKNTSYAALRVNISVRRGGGYFVDTLDLYAARPRAAFVTLATRELEVDEAVVKRDLGEVLLGLEAAQEARMEALLRPKETAPTMGEAERDAALSLLKDPRLLERIVEDLGACGLVGEDENKLLAYLAATSRLLERPLAVVIQSTSAAGKSSLMEAVLSLIPEEHRVSFSAMTGQSLFYMGQDELKHKVLAVSEEEGAERASYALKLLQSEGSLTIASTGKDPVSGKHVTHTYRVEGPVQLFQTTTAIEMDEELLNRCLVLTVDEGRAQTRAILALQREAETLEGLLVKEARKELRALHQNAQRLLRPLLVVNPFARALSFSDEKTRMRRDHGKYLGLMRTLALLHQHQRPVKTAEHAGKVLEYVEVEPSDVEVAGRLMESVLARSMDELPPQTRGVLQVLEAQLTERAQALRVLREEARCTQREVRGWTGLSATQVRRHLQRLELLELVFVVRGKKTWEYVLGEPSEASRHRAAIAPPRAGSDVAESFPSVDVIAPAAPRRSYPAVSNGASYT